MAPQEPVANLDFEARVPVPFSVFPSSYKETAEVETTTHTHEELEIQPPLRKPDGLVESFPSYMSLIPFSVVPLWFRHTREFPLPPFFNPSKPSTSTYSAHTDSYVEVDHQHRPHHSPIDAIEREYRARNHPVYKEEVRVESTVDVPPPSRHSHSHSRPIFEEEIHVSESTTEPSHHHYHEDTTTVVEETTEYPPRPQINSIFNHANGTSIGHHHPYSSSSTKMADKYHSEDVVVRSSGGSPKGPPNTVSIPCHHIRMGDILILQGRPCQVIRISTSGATGQHRYLGVDLFTKQLHEESSQVQHPGPSVVVQTMFGPVFKQYRVLDMQDGNIVAMTESGDVKPGLPVSEQGNLWGRLTQAFESGRGSVRVLVLSDAGRELAVDMKVIHGSRL
ncbi:Woronin body major protein [Apiospora saccharicola]